MPKTAVITDPDALRIEHLLALKRHPGYMIMVEEITRRVMNGTKALLDCPPEELKELQGRLKSLQAVVGIPDELIAVERAAIKAKENPPKPSRVQQIREAREHDR